ncbi:dihydrodipicolinate synthase family protein [Corynebacterium pseudodiphtheriticum]|uniref:Dihydrodipicolinate synthase family protein n=1 Tax=Corynebacterium pseudodiphtheriticum TaxID=37637 RepID=A0ABT7FVF8_9CORY|nr:dihydrodipicolinate synthase family protein [Corynebacterium pseudodiphtheriticum]MDK4289974.1 dihydrodipicolinate synthase family protein [Corynebacterium pseudodiphtheriticum]
MFTGVYCPSITPFHSDGSIDFQAWEAHLERLISGGISGVLIFGSIGEFYALSMEQKKQAIEFVSQVVQGRMHFFIGSGSTRIEEVKELNAHGLKHRADAAVVVSPYYFGPSDELAVQYFTELADASELPIVLYNFPDRTGNDLSAELISRIAQAHPNIVGVKDTVDSAAHTRRVIRDTPDSFSVLSGFDEYYFPNRIAGGQGVLCGLTNVVPEIFGDMHRAYESGDLAAAAQNAEKIAALMSVYEVGDHFIHTIKHAVRYASGADFSTATHEPYIELTRAQQEEIARLIDTARS